MTQEGRAEYRVRWLRNDGAIQEFVMRASSLYEARNTARRELMEDCETFVRILSVEIEVE